MAMTPLPKYVLMVLKSVFVFVEINNLALYRNSRGEVGSSYFRDFN